MGRKNKLLLILIAFSPFLYNGNVFAIDKWSIKNDKHKIYANQGRTYCYCVSFSKNSKYIFSFDLEKVQVLDSRDLREISSFKKDGYAKLSDGTIVTSKDCQLLWSYNGSDDLGIEKTKERDKEGVLKVFNRLTKKNLFSFKYSYSDYGPFVAVSADTSLAAYTNGTKNLTIYDIKNSREIKTISMPSSETTSIDISPDKKYVVVGHPSEAGYNSLAPPPPNLRAGNVTLIDLNIGKSVWTTDDGGDHYTRYARPTYVRFSSHGRQLVSGAHNKLQMRETSTGDIIYSVDAYGESFIESLSLAKDGSILASADCFGSIKLWNTSTFEEIPSLSNASHLEIVPSFHSINKNDSIYWLKTNQLLCFYDKGFTKDVKLVYWDLNAGTAVKIFNASVDYDYEKNKISGTLIDELNGINKSSIYPSDIITCYSDSRWTTSIRFSPTHHRVLKMYEQITSVVVSDTLSGKQLYYITDHVRQPPQGDVVIDICWPSQNAFSKNENKLFFLDESNHGPHHIKCVDLITQNTEWEIESQAVEVFVTNDKNFIVTQEEYPSGIGNKTRLQSKLNFYNCKNGHLEKQIAIPEKYALYSVSKDNLSFLLYSNENIILWNSVNKLTETTIDLRISDIVSLIHFKDRIVWGLKDGSINIWDTKSSSLIAKLFVFDDNEWVILTPEGFFNASQKGAKYLNIKLGEKVFSIDQFYDQLYRPDLVQAKLAGDPEGLVLKAAKDINIALSLASGEAPEINFINPKHGVADNRDVDITVGLTAQGGGIGKLIWKLNGVTIGVEESDRGIKVQKKDQTRLRQIDIQESRLITLSPGTNQIEVIVYNAAGTIASDPAVLNLDLKDSISEPPALYIISVGINRYRDKSLWLKYAVPDGKSLSSRLKSAGKRIFSKVLLTEIYDENATLEGIKQTFAQISKKAKTNDVFILFMAGHGITLDGRYHFLPADFRYHNEDSVRKNAINQDHLQKWLSTIPALKSLVLLDTCNSGSYVEAQAVSRGLAEKTAIDKLTRSTGRAVIAASSDTQVALEGYEGHGVFTYALLNGLQQADNNYGNKDGVISTTELSSYVNEVVPKITFKKWGYEQVPQANLHGREFPIGVVRSERDAATAPIPVQDTKNQEGKDLETKQPTTPSSINKPAHYPGDTYIVESIHPDNPKWNNVTKRLVISVESDKLVMTSQNLVSKSKTIRTLEYTPGWNLISTRNANGSGVDFSPPLKYYEFPLKPGKTWKQNSVATNVKTGSTREFSLSGVVGGWEDVSVPAGTFKGIKVTLNSEIFVPATGKRSFGTDISWYVPELRRSVKSEMTSRNSEGVEGRQLIQLREYELGETNSDKPPIVSAPLKEEQTSYRDKS